ncbi:MAG: hypothetical protein H7Y12_12360 [Sphingobacteriaceae bacterium]|nr:hypothetical protein [Cytophagaceae bacterium]
MAYDLLDYLSWQRRLELRELELRDVIIWIEQQLHETRKVIWEVRNAEEEFDDFVLGSLIMDEIHLKKLLEQYSDELEESLLDMTHTRFMIERLNYQ